ncbi:hypothetical protein C8R46DRAFT_1165008 [Mycena filopes]|nr:hypothetical protein C8R46DRAFT_1165008 [Mycena filopes]
MASAGSSSSKPPPPTSASEAEIDKLLSREASALQREIEVERILKAFKLNPYDILDIDESSTAEEIKKRYKQLSLTIHPDKTPHPRAPEAFDILKKAESELSDEGKRENMDAIINQSRSLILKSLSLPLTTPSTDPALRRLDPSFRVRMRAQTKELLIEEELRRRKAVKMNLANEVAGKKRKAEEDRVWEDNRDQRVDSWRTFAKDNKKKKKAKVTLLG